VDLTVNDHVKETFIKRTKCSTPCVLSLTTEAILKWKHLQPIPGGAARPFITPQLA
jgi:lysyl-tRNA synthetase class 2